MMLVGGCTGSTAGGIKMFRLCVLLEALRAQTHRQIYPHGTFVVTYNGQPVTDTVRAGVTLYFFVYLTTFFIFALLLGLLRRAVRSQPRRARRRRSAASAPASARSSVRAAPSRRCRTRRSGC